LSAEVTKSLYRESSMRIFYLRGFCSRCKLSFYEVDARTCDNRCDTSSR